MGFTRKQDSTSTLQHPTQLFQQAVNVSSFPHSSRALPIAGFLAARSSRRLQLALLDRSKKPRQHDRPVYVFIYTPPALPCSDRAFLFILIYVLYKNYRRIFRTSQRKVEKHFCRPQNTSNDLVREEHLRRAEQERLLQARLWVEHDQRPLLTRVYPDTPLSDLHRFPLSPSSTRTLVAHSPPAVIELPQSHHPYPPLPGPRKFDPTQIKHSPNRDTPDDDQSNHRQTSSAVRRPGSEQGKKLGLNDAAEREKDEEKERDRPIDGHCIISPLGRRSPPGSQIGRATASKKSDKACRADEAAAVAAMADALKTDEVHAPVKKIDDISIRGQFE
ncbi:hypothetical protein Agabi119p4_6990 [Agaricus bisporus var. burnettii]|uniref:Uncharacterized protein n=1 Tax=Agaricus bisporus var. burnettii TaxID=192524 RepID=A0A8H7KBB7_AGABI|nr:hypothetical protein Agabi119p4_6990 [Agaricus bisporus var. burnettii]